MRNSGCTMDRYGSAWSGAQLQRGQTGHMAAPCHSMAPWARLHVPAIQRTHRRHSLLRTACAAKEDGRDEPSLKGPEDACVSLFPLPESFIRELAAQEGVRVTFQQADPDEDEDDWDEVMSDLSDPWMRSPGALSVSCDAAVKSAAHGLLERLAHLVLRNSEGCTLEHALLLRCSVHLYLHRLRCSLSCLPLSPSPHAKTQGCMPPPLCFMLPTSSTSRHRLWLALPSHIC